MHALRNAFLGIRSLVPSSAIKQLTIVQARSKSTTTAFNFTGKRAVVTGAGKGIGYDICKSLANAGADVIAVTRTQKDLDKLCSEVGDAIVPVLLDIADADAVKERLSNVGNIDMLVNNAGIANLQMFMDVTPEKFKQVMDINVGATVSVSQICAENMIQRGVAGSIVNVSSQASKVGLRNHASYCASKGAMDQLTRVMAMELGEKNIRVNAVLPTVVLTELGRAAWSDPKTAGPMLSRIPSGRFAEIEDVVGPVLFLLSDEAAMVNGAFLPIDGGFLSTGI